MKPEDLERIEIIRRIAERGLRMALSPPTEGNYVDIFQHMLDEIDRVGDSK